MKLLSANEKGLGKLALPKKIVYPLMLVLLSSFAWAQSTATGLMHQKMPGMQSAGFVGLMYFIVGCFIFSAVFWLTHNWLVKNKK